MSSGKRPLFCLGINVLSFMMPSPVTNERNLVFHKNEYQKQNESLWISYRMLNNLLGSKPFHNFDQWKKFSFS